jgi:hypothetical protein
MRQGEAPMGEADTPTMVTHSSFVDRRNGVDTRSPEERQRMGERRSGLDRRQTMPFLPGAAGFAQQVLGASAVEQKLDLLARATVEIASALAEIERRIRAIQQNTANHRL